MTHCGVCSGSYHLGKEAKAVVNDGIGSSTVGSVILMDIARVVSGIFFPVPHECE